MLADNLTRNVYIVRLAKILMSVLSVFVCVCVCVCVCVHMSVSG